MAVVGWAKLRRKWPCGTHRSSAHTTVCLHVNGFATYLLHIIVAMCDVVQSGMAIFLRVQQADGLLIASALHELHTVAIGILTKHNTSEVETES